MMADLHNCSGKLIAYILIRQLLCNIIWQKRNKIVFFQVNFSNRSVIEISLYFE